MIGGIATESELLTSYLYQDINIYDNTVPVLTNNFISPIADNGPLFYRFTFLTQVLFDNTLLSHVILPSQ